MSYISIGDTNAIEGNRTFVPRPGHLTYSITKFICMHTRDSNMIKTKHQHSIGFGQAPLSGDAKVKNYKGKWSKTRQDKVTTRPDKIRRVGGDDDHDDNMDDKNNRPARRPQSTG